MAKRAGLADAFMSRWREQNLDVVLSPILPMPAPHKEFHSSITSSHITFYFFYINVPEIYLVNLKTFKKNSEEKGEFFLRLKYFLDIPQYKSISIA